MDDDFGEDCEDEFMIEGKVFLITGGTGSFGKTMTRHLLSNGAKQVSIFSRDEKKQEDMRIDFNDSRLKLHIGDVRDYAAINDALIGVDNVFHAAALKQVPSCEFFPMEAVKTNVLGTENVINGCIKNKVSRIVVLSTDKAVYPINAMGISKAMGEKVAVAMSRGASASGLIVCCTRYGNVMASRGSVIPLFVDQIRSGKDITITDPEMTRFLMSLDQSVDLVLHAFDHGKTGDIFVQKAPASTVRDLAQALLSLFSATNTIRTIGTRHGEKLYETLISREEMAKASDMGLFYRIPADNRDLNYGQFTNEGEEKVSTADDYTSHNTEQLDINGIKSALLKLSFIKDSLDD